MRKSCRQVLPFGMALEVVLFLFLGAAMAAAQTAPTTSAPLKEVAVGAEAFSLGDPPPSWVEPVAIPEADASRQTSMRLADTQYFVADMPVIYVRRAIVVNDAASLGSVGQIPIPFIPDYQRLQLHTVRILRGGETLDQTHSATIRFLQRETGLEHGVYSGVVTASILVNDLRVGDTLEYAYSLFGQNPVFGKKYVDTASWDGPLPTALRRVVLKFPASRTINWRVLGDDQPKPLTPTETLQNGIRRLVFEEHDLPGIQSEPLMPPDYIRYRWLQFSEFSGWDDVVTWASGLFQSAEPLDEDLRKVVEKLRAAGSEEQRVVGALEFVQSQIRYFSVSLGESSHRPTPPNMVFRRRYGDCKDKSFLLISLLKALGVESRPALLKIGSGHWLDKALPSPLDFDHVIVQARVGGQSFFLDPTRLGQHGRLDRMGQVHEGTEVLLVAPDSHGPATVTFPGPLALVHSEVSETATLAKLGGPGEIQVRQVWNGVSAEAMRVVQSSVPRERFLKSISSMMEIRYPGATLDGDPQVNDDRANNVFTMTSRFSVPNLAIEKGGAWLIRFLPTNMRGALALSPEAARRAPLAIRAYPLDARYSFEAHLPNEISAVRDPIEKTVDDKYFTYAITSSFRGNLAKTVVELKTHADRVPVQDLPKFSQDVRSINDLAPGAVIIGKADIKSGTAATGFAERIRARLEETSGKISEAIKSGKLTGSDLAAAYCARSQSYGHLGRLDDAFRDANEALKLIPNSGEAFACRGYLYLLSGAFAKSIADYSHAVTLGATMPDVFGMRGLAKFYAGRLDEAAEDFAKASRADDKEGRLYTDLWLMWTDERLHKPIPEALAERARGEAHGDWPRPALAMFAGAMTPDDVLKTIDSKTGDDREMALTEGYFYLGQLYFARGDKDKAKEMFEKTRAQGMLPYLEHIAAGFELQQMGAMR